MTAVALIKSGGFLNEFLFNGDKFTVLGRFERGAWLTGQKRPKKYNFSEKIFYIYFRSKNRNQKKG